MAVEKNCSWESRVAIIGGGISGIAAAKQLCRYKPVVFEASDSVGGVWKHCSYRSTRLQTPRRDYEFSDYPWPEPHDEGFPTHIEIVEYLHGYATHFDVLKLVQFNSKVVEIRFVGSDQHSERHSRPLTGRPVWEVGVQRKESDDVQWYSFEFVVMCTGKYGDTPRQPAFPLGKGPEVFRGKVMHTLDYCKLNTEATQRLMKGKKVVVVGYKKSAIDLAVECAEANQGPDGQPCTMLVRTLHWTVPSYWIWGLPFFLFYSTRTSQFLHERPNQSFLGDLFCLMSSPLRRAVSKLIESYLVWKLPLKKYGLVPDHPFEEDYASCQMAILPENFFSEAEQGRILFEKSQKKWWFYDGGIVLEDDTRVEADVVMLATGFDGKSKLKSILPAPFRDLIENSSGVIPLYRSTIHPLIPNMAFVGYVESVSNLHSAELRCKWLARLLDDHFTLPSVKRMLEQTNEELEVMKRTTRFYKRHCISTFSINHSDEICEEMGWNSWRKTNWLSEAFSAYNNQDYRED
ncbi:probable flavin-containing monooxygenase 1 [Aristolochia californica]|uniref:probable flavin-containing monooxygenase 1 n=1 Tax=Aristolochia californica TaxID=171875 RepID=UPI0035D95A4C